NRIAFSATQIEQVIERFHVPQGTTRAFGFASYTTRLAPAAAPMVEKGNTDRTFTFTISTPAVDRAGDSIAIAGWRLGNYRRNPVVLWGHDGKLLPVGRGTGVWIEQNKLKSTVQLAPAEANPDAEKVFQMIKGGFIGAASVGFLPLKFSFSDKPDRKF